MNQADVLVFDSTVSPAIIELARRDATRITAPSERSAIVELLVRHARAGQRVVYMKPGDAFRKAPEHNLWSALEAQGVLCEIIPGIGA